MKIIFTGAGSFTGYWIIKKLVEDGHTVYPLFEEASGVSSGARGERIKRLSEITECFFGINYSKSEFFEFLSRLEGADAFCQHFFDTKDYKSPDYDMMSALRNSVGDVNRLFQELKRLGCVNFMLTGSSFEENEGASYPLNPSSNASNPSIASNLPAGTAPLAPQVPETMLPAFSPYGLSKTLAAEAFSYYSGLYGLKFSKFVIPNPFGPLEEYKFTSWLAAAWLKGETPSIKAPDYVRDNIPADLLALAYSGLVSRISAGEEIKKINPSGYAESNAEFVKRMSKELSARLGIKCAFKLEKQSDFSEPLVRYNTDKMFEAFPGYPEKKFWDELAAYYDESFRNKKNGN